MRLPVEVSNRLLRACFLLALSAQLFLYHTYFSYQGSDRNQQLWATSEWLQGRGLSVHEAAGSDLSQKTYRPLQGWPPGYSVLIAPIYLMCTDWWLSERILGSLAILLVFSAMWAWWRFLPLPRLAELGFWGLWLVSFTPFHYTGTSDELALGFALWGMWGVVRGINGLPWAFFFGLACLLASSWMRYAYLPLSWMLPLFLGMAWWLHRQDTKVRPFFLSMTPLISLAGCGLSTLVLLQYAPLTNREGEAVIQLAGRWYPENWLMMDAFPLKAFVYLSVEGLLNKLSSLSRLEPLLRVLVALPAFGIGLLCVRTLWPCWMDFCSKTRLKWPRLTHGVGLFTLLAFAQAGMLLLLSLIHPPEVLDGSRSWTYAMETRYYALVLVGIQAVVWVAWARPAHPRWRRLGAAVVLGLSLVYGSVHSGYRYLATYGLKRPHETTHRPEEQLMKWMYDYLAQSDSTVILLHGNSIYARDLGSVAGLAGASQLSFASATAPSTSQPLPILLYHARGEQAISPLPPLAVEILEQGQRLFENEAGSIYFMNLE